MKLCTIACNTISITNRIRGVLGAGALVALTGCAVAPAPAAYTDFPVAPAACCVVAWHATAPRIPLARPRAAAHVRGVL
ncbi:hypothetical protein LMG29739_01658 [Paraburkholderia solisilvae]|uniref:Lipoprotein n=1 Tax=Paraburkholderia solisilvae TaxID=624376 RepID=A0A6J5DFV8_9BURK|nr:hypothetical protein LMG29739_01658 [Paraburkholderia solisilvae]